MEISIIFFQLIQLFLILFIGFFLYKYGLFTKDTNQRLTKLLLKVTLPATILNSVLSQSQRPSGNLVVSAFVIAALMYLLFPVVSFLLVKALRLPKADQGMYIFMSTYGNVGFMGFPIIEAVFGTDAVFYAAIFNVLFNLSCFSIGILIMHYGSEKKASIDWRACVTPSTVSSFAAILIYAANLQIPSVLCETVRTVSAVTTPLSMMLIGSTLATMPFREIFHDLRIYPFAVIRQFVLPLLLWPLLSLTISDVRLLGVTFVLFSMPVANTSVLFATEYHGNEQLAAKTVFITTAMTIVTVPLLLFLCH